MDGTRRVLIFSLMYLPKYVGGHEVAIRELTTRLAHRGIRFDLITLRLDRSLPRDERIGNVAVHRVGFSGHEVSSAEFERPITRLNKLLFPVAGLLKTLGLRGHSRYDAVWSISSGYAGIAAVLSSLTMKGVPILLSQQNARSSSMPWWDARLRGVVDSVVLARADVIQAISSYLAAEAASNGATCDIEIIPNGVDLRHFSAACYDNAHDRPGVNALRAEGDVLLVTASRLVPSKGLDDVIQALALLPQRYRFLVLGDGPQRQQLMALSTSLGVDDRVSFLGHVDHHELPGYLKISDIFVRPSLVEGMGNAFVEAMAVGIPVIATQVGGISDFLFDPELDPDKPPTGRAVEPNSPQQIADATRAYVDDPTTTAVIVQNARRLVEQKYDWDLIADEMYEKVLTRLFDRRP